VDICKESEKASKPIRCLHLRYKTKQLCDGNVYPAN